MSGSLVAQNNDTNEVRLDENISAQTELNDVNEWDNPFELFVGVWSLERTVENAEGVETKIYPGTFMIVHSDAAYTIFVNTDVGAVITSQGNILIASPDVYLEVISQHVNSSLVGVSNRIEYKLNADYLYKTFWIERDIHGDEYKREVKETWKRAKMPIAGMHEDNPGFPI
jgi:hypothetical protein